MHLLMWLHNLGYSHLDRESTIPSASASQCNNLTTNNGSIGLSNLRLESNVSEPNTPTTQHSYAHGPQPGDRDSFWRLVIEPVGYNASELTIKVCTRIRVRFHLTPRGRCSTNLRNIMYELPNMEEVQIDGLCYWNIGVVMKNLKRGVRLGRWLAHQKMEALCTLVELLARLLGRKEWHIVVVYLLKVRTDHLHKKKTTIFGDRVHVNSIYGLTEKA
ncbi:hypothetical protein KY289_016541 [Solanum tuberosum]|nr:hypothetical protein KY289_016541 [Solanum tuberosum]